MTEQANTTATEAKNTIVVSTKSHAKYLRELAEKRVEKATTAYQEALKDVEKYKELEATLPESVAAPAKAKRTYEVGDEVNFEYGRTETRVKLVGKVKAKNADSTQYLIEVGEGFESKQYKVFGGAINGKVGEAEQAAEPETDPLAPQEPDDSTPGESADDPLSA